MNTEPKPEHCDFSELRAAVKKEMDAHGENERRKDVVGQGASGIDRGKLEAELSRIEDQIDRSLTYPMGAEWCAKTFGRRDELRKILAAASPEQGHEPWPGTPGAQNDTGRLEEVISAFNSYIELLGAEINDLMGLHIAHGSFTSKRVREGHDCRLRVEKAIDAARGVQPAAQPNVEHRGKHIDIEYFSQPAAQEGAPAAEPSVKQIVEEAVRRMHDGHGGIIRDGFTYAVIHKAVTRAIAATASPEEKV